MNGHKVFVLYKLSCICLNYLCDQILIQCKDTRLGILYALLYTGISPSKDASVPSVTLESQKIKSVKSKVKDH